MHPTQEDTVLVLLDTEGLGDVDKDDEDRDLTIFTLVTLLSSILIYNMEEMSKNITFNGKCNDRNSHMVLPSFALVLRNFTKKLATKDGPTITADEYLKIALENKAEKRETYNKTRESIKDCFQTRRCFALPPPGDVDLIENLENTPLSGTCSRFQTTIRQLVEYVHNEQPKRHVASKPINGSVFASLVGGFVENIAKDGTSDVDATYTMAAVKENETIGTVASSIFKRRMEDLGLPFKRHNYISYALLREMQRLNMSFKMSLLTS
ncbi:guanylate-binding protein 2-like [Mya arenaria]|uniref:guanylate-binding protein 2-like n=1 Tax=Mya arenaria TaxID=6604 RepID=UPI0022E3D751|nr:guanylate-binding protein 2-like [Mya arenaria]